MIGIHIGMLPGNTFGAATEIFQQLRERYSLSACEIHLERSLYSPAIWPWDSTAQADAAALRSTVARMGVHLPFVDMNPVSANPRISEVSRSILEESLEFASQIRADYAVFHARGHIEGNGSREKELRLWKDVVAGLGEKASSLGVTFCLENADDLRDMREVRLLLGGLGKSVRMCLDIGHLFERRYSASFLPRLIYALNDRISPFPFAWTKGLPMETGYDWHRTIGALAGGTACIHLHSHDGRAAHCRLKKGKIDFTPLRNLAKLVFDIPVILEADYSRCTVDEIGDDIRYLGELLS